jgi:hypothetical protein
MTTTRNDTSSQPKSVAIFLFGLAIGGLVGVVGTFFTLLQWAMGG